MAANTDNELKLMELKAAVGHGLHVQINCFYEKLFFYKNYYKNYYIIILCSFIMMDGQED